MTLWAGKGPTGQDGLLHRVKLIVNNIQDVRLHHISCLVKAHSQSLDDIQDLWVLGDLSDVKKGVKNGEVDLVFTRRDFEIPGDD